MVSDALVADSLPRPVTTPWARRRWDYLFTLSVPVVAILSAVHGIKIGPMRHTGLLWMATLFVGVCLILVRGPRRVTFPWRTWAPFFIYTFVALAWSDWSFKYNVQLYFQMLTFYVVGVVASTAIESKHDLKSWSQGYLWTGLSLALLCVFFHVGPGKALQGGENAEYQGFADRVAAMTAIVVGAVFLAQLRQRPLLALFMWGTGFGVAILSGSRMVTLVLLVLWLAHPRLASLHARILVALGMMAVGLLAFNTPIIQERFFEKKSGFAGKGSVQDVASGNFDSAGRFESWPKILEKSRDNPWFGHGTGQSAFFVLKVWAPMDKPHNEYLKMLFDGGYVGLACFVWALGGTWLNLSRLVRQSDQPDDWIASAAYMAHVGFILMAVCDNPLVYAGSFLDPLFAMIGAANAVGGRARDDRNDRFMKPVDARPSLPAWVPLR